MSSNFSFPNPNSLLHAATNLQKALLSLLSPSVEFLLALKLFCRAGENHMAGPAENLALARRYLKALEWGPTGHHLGQFFAPEVVVEIFPSKFFPNGSRDDLAGISSAAERGQKVMTSQK